MFLIMILLAVTVGFTAGAAVAKKVLHVQARRAPTAVEHRNHLDAIALLRDVVNTPDALTLRGRATKVIASFEATNRKDT